MNPVHRVQLILGSPNFIPNSSISEEVVASSLSSALPSGRVCSTDPLFFEVFSERDSTVYHTASYVFLMGDYFRGHPMQASFTLSYFESCRRHFERHSLGHDYEVSVYSVDGSTSHLEMQAALGFSLHCSPLVNCSPQRRELQFVTNLTFLPNDNIDLGLLGTFSNSWELGSRIQRDRNRTTPSFINEIRRIADRHGAQMEVISNLELRDQGFGGIFGVGRAGSTTPDRYPAFVSVHHTPLGDSQRPIAVIGKGILFDTGGYNLKPISYSMHLDCGGACSTLALMNFVLERGINRNFSFYFPLAFNLVSENSLLMGETVTLFGGETMQILNTDAEGRIILADALSYVGRRENPPSHIIMISTLTGETSISLGPVCFPIRADHSSPGLTNLIGDSANQIGEIIDVFPSYGYDWWDSQIANSRVADFANVGTRRVSYCNLAVHTFTRVFLGLPQDIEVSHLDIGGYSDGSEGSPYNLGPGPSEGGVPSGLLALGTYFLNQSTNQND